MKETKIFISPTIHQLKKKPIDSNFQLLYSKTDCHSQNPRIRRRLKKKIHVKTVEDCRVSYKKDKYVSTFSFSFFYGDQLKLSSRSQNFPHLLVKLVVDWTSSLLRRRGSSHEFSNASASSK